MVTNIRFIISAWFLALVPSVPNLFFFKTKPLEDREECVNDFVGLKIDGLIKKGYFIIVFLVIFVIPLVRAFKTCPVAGPVFFFRL